MCRAVLRGDSAAQTPAWCLASTAVVSASRTPGWQSVPCSSSRRYGCTDSSLMHHLYRCSQCLQKAAGQSVPCSSSRRFGCTDSSLMRHPYRCGQCLQQAGVAKCALQFFEETRLRRLQPDASPLPQWSVHAESLGGNEYLAVLRGDSAARTPA